MSAPWLAAVQPGPRSRLHRLEPVGLGTPMVEGLASYVTRLAASHALPLGCLAVDVIGPELGRTRVYGADRSDRASFFSSSIYRGPHSLNGVGEYAELWAGAIGRLVLRDGLDQLTMRPWREVLPKRGLMRQHLAVCPPCLREGRNEGRPAHEPLLWSIAEVRACPLHERLLRHTCPECDARSPLLSWHARTGHCRHCASWLGAEGLDQEPAGAWDRWVAANVGRILVRPLEARGRSGSTAEVIEAAITRASAGNAAAFAAAIGRSRSLITEWRQGLVVPTLDSLLRIAAVARFDFPALVAGAAVFDPDGPPPPDSATWPKEPRSPRDWPLVEEAFRAALRADPPPALAAVCRRLGVDDQLVRDRIPELAKELVARHRQWAKQQAVARRQSLVSAVREAVALIRRSGEHPSRRRVEALLPPGISLREPGLQAAWRELLAEA